MAVSGKIRIKKTSKDSFAVFLDSTTVDAKKFIKRGIEAVSETHKQVSLINFSFQDSENSVYDISDLSGLFRVVDNGNVLRVFCDHAVVRKFAKKYAKGNVDKDGGEDFGPAFDLFDNFFGGFLNDSKKWIIKNKPILGSKFSISEIKL